MPSSARSAAQAAVRELFTGRDLGTFQGEFTALVDPHDVCAIKLTPDVVLPGYSHWRPWHQAGQTIAQARRWGELQGGQAGLGGAERKGLCAGAAGRHQAGRRGGDPGAEGARTAGAAASRHWQWQPERTVGQSHACATLVGSQRRTQLELSQKLIFMGAWQGAAAPAFNRRPRRPCFPKPRTAF